MFKFHSEHAIFEKLIHVYLIDSLYRKTGSTRILKQIQKWYDAIKLLTIMCN